MKDKKVSYIVGITLAVILGFTVIFDLTIISGLAVIPLPSLSFFTGIS